MAAAIHVTTNLSGDNFRDGETAQGIVATIASKFGISEEVQFSHYAPYYSSVNRYLHTNACTMKFYGLTINV